GSRIRNGSLKRLTRYGSTASSESGPPRFRRRTPARGSRTGDRIGITTRLYNLDGRPRSGKQRGAAPSSGASRRTSPRPVLPRAGGVAGLVQQVFRHVGVLLQDGKLLVEERLHLGLHVALGVLHDLDHLLVTVHHHLRESAIEVLPGHPLQLIHL